MTHNAENLAFQKGQVNALLTAISYSKKNTYSYEKIEERISKLEKLIREMENQQVTAESDGKGGE